MTAGVRPEMTARQTSNTPPLLKRVARPVLRPLLRALGWGRWQKTLIPLLARRGRLRAAEVPSRVSVREDQTFLLNGSPFFPNGLYYARAEVSDPTGAGLRRLREMGFNTIFFDGGLDSGRELDRIWDAGLHVWYRPPGQLYSNFGLLKQVVSRFARHPAVLFWEMDDEPALNGLKLSDVEAGRRIVRGVDPYHPIHCNQWLSSLDQAEEMMRWAELSDSYGFSVYPVPSWRWGKRLSLVEAGWPHSIAVVGRQTELWKSYAPGKPIIPVLQAWAWNCLEDGDAAYPTYGECRFMVYHAVINGAKGLRHYGVTSPDRPYFACGIPPAIREDLDQTHADFLKARRHNERFWGYYARVVKEVSRMGRVFASYDAGWVPQVRETSPGAGKDGVVECRIKRHLDTAVILMVNASGSPAEVEVLAPRMSGRALRLWGRGGVVRVSPSGLFRDQLEPFGVRVYSDAPDLLSEFSDLMTRGDEHVSTSNAAQ